MKCFVRAWRHGVLIAGLVLGFETQAAGDPARGSKVFQACMACHSVTPGEHMTGPSLAHIWNSKAGTIDDFLRYSDAMKKADVMWNDANLDKWLANPQRLLPGTSMSFAGIREENVRQDVIAYLKSVAEGKAPSGARQRAIGGKPDLKKAPPDGQVTSIEHCRDTYTVKTADGKATKVWEFNLRFKTDSGKLGPSAGKPVIAGAGMQGDRASVIFAAPAEISSFIKQSCG